MKNSHFSLLKCVPTTPGTSNATSHSINNHHYRLYAKWLLQHNIIASLKGCRVCTKYGHYMIIMIVLTIVICVCSRIVIPQNLTIAHLQSIASVISYISVCLNQYVTWQQPLCPLSNGLVEHIDKCNWTPVQQITWLGFFLDLDKGQIFVPTERVKRLKS